MCRLFKNRLTHISHQTNKNISYDAKKNCFFVSLEKFVLESQKNGRKTKHINMKKQKTYRRNS